MSKNQELIVIENLDPAKLFAGEGLDELLSSVEKHVNSLHHDISMATGRKDLASFCRKIAGAKNGLDLLGKNHVAGKKQELKIFDANRKKAKDFLQNLQDGARQPLTDWEDAEKVRAEAISDRIEGIKDLAPSDSILGALSIGDIEGRIESLTNLAIDESFEEMASIASAAKEESLQTLVTTLENLKIQTEKDDELARLQKLEAEQKQKDHDEQVKRDAEAKAKADAAAELEQANTDKEEAIRAEQQAIEAVEHQKATAEQQARDAKIEASRQAESAKIEADKQAKQAAQAERDRIAAEKKAEEAATAARERNTQHKGRVNRGIVTAIIKAIPSASEAEAKRLVTDMAKGDITNVTINY